MTPTEIVAAIQAFMALEPEVQKGIAALIHKLFDKTPAPAPTQSA